MKQKLTDRNNLASADEAPAFLSTIQRDLWDTNGGVALILGKQRLHGEHLERIIELVTPNEKEEGEGPSFDELLGGLAVRLDNRPPTSGTSWSGSGREAGYGEGMILRSFFQVGSGSWFHPSQIGRSVDS